MIIKLENTTTHQTYEYEVVDANNGEKLYFRFDINTADLDEGEYKLELVDNGEIIATDLLKIGDFNTNTLQYKKGDNTYIAVTLDPNVQDKKQVEIDSINATVSPDVGYTSMAQVAIDAKPLYDSAYNEGYVDGEGIGYTDGYDAGIEHQKELLENITITENGTYTKEDGYNEIIVDVPDLNGAYTDGYDDGLKDGEDIGYNKGFESGIEEQKNQLISISITENGTYNREDGYNEVVVNVPDINGSYDEGFTDGVTTQKSKLTSISITENGTYEKEDGYNKIVVEIEDTNGSYDEGFADGVEEGVSNAGEIIAETAQVLNITENGNYLTKYSDPIIFETETTGIFDDGTEFTNYAILNSSYFNTGIIPTPNSRIEFWYKDTENPSGDAYFLIIGAGSEDKENNCYQIRSFAGSYYCNWGQYPKSITRPETNVWHHYIISKEDGIIVDGDKKQSFSSTPKEINSPFYINGAEYSPTRNINGCFGMFKIDGQTIIPTEDGFKNITTGELLKKQGGYEYVNTEPIYGEGNLIKTVNVNITPKINIAKSNIKFAYSKITEVPDWADWDGINDMGSMFRECTKLEDLGNINTSNVTNMDNCFYNCSKLSDFKDIDLSNLKKLYYTFSYTNINDETVAKFNTSNITDMNYAFSFCSNLINVPLIDTSNVTNMANMFIGCMNIEEVAPINTSKVTNMSYMFYDFSAEHKLRKLPEFDCTNVTNMGNMFSYYQDKMDYFTDCGGWKNLKCNWNDSYGLRACANLTYESCINILNGLYDFTGNGGKPTSSQGKLKVHQNFLDLVGDEISIGTNKGWTITA